MLENTENIIIFDWFSFTSKVDSPDEIKKILGLSSVTWTEMNGMHGYRNRYYFNSISIHYDRDDGTVWCEMSGQGCRAYETYSTCCDWIGLFNLVTDNVDGLILPNKDYHVTRLDVAYDDWQGLLKKSTLQKSLKDNNVVTKFRDYGNEHQSYTKKDFTLYLGSKKSEVYMRIYDKAAEREREDVEHWIRFEMQLRNDRAFCFIQSLFDNNFDIGTVFFGVLNNYVRFVKPSLDTNKSRWFNAPWWDKFTRSVSKISLWSRKTVDYNYSTVKNYVVNQCGNAIDCLIEIDGIDKFFDDIKKRKVLRNPKYDKIVEDTLSLRAMNEGVEF